jgi:hypothetical protein
MSSRFTQNNQLDPVSITIANTALKDISRLTLLKPVATGAGLHLIAHLSPDDLVVSSIIEDCSHGWYKQINL